MRTDGLRSAVITGVGVISPNGVGCEAYTEALCAGRSGIAAMPFDASMLHVHHAGVVRGFAPENVLSSPDIRRTPRTVHLAAGAAREALAMAGLLKPGVVTGDNGHGDRCALPEMGVLLGTGGGGIAFVESQYRLYFTGQRGYSPFTITSGTHGNLASELSIRYGLHGPSHCISTGCTSSTDALGTALLHLRAGTCPGFLVGGADAPLAEGIVRGFELMRILAADREPAAAMSRPFARDRDGFVLGEGAWMFVVEDAESAVARGAEPLAEILGYASTCDAYHRVQPAPDSAESARAITMALAHAGVAPDDLDYINLHGTSTQLNDVLETRALHLALGESARTLGMSATKSMIGHPQGASGAAGIAATILPMRAGFLHPTINLRDSGEGDAACDLDYIAEGARPLPQRARDTQRGGLALCNCIAFGSKNSALVLRVNHPRDA